MPSLSPSMSANLNPLSTLRVSSHQIAAYAMTPNTSIQNKPLLIYHQAFRPGTSASAMEGHLSTVGVVTPQWRYTMYSRSHFHSTSQEVLCVYAGSARLCFGCEDNAARIEPEVASGDVLVVPAGVSHRLLEDKGGDFRMVGSYPTGKHWDMCYGEKGEEGKIARIMDLGWFTRDPLYGNEGPALTA